MDDFTITSARRSYGTQQRSKELRVAAHRVEWLDGEPMWQDDRVVWKIGNETFAPRPTDLARTHFRLRQLTDNPGKARQILKDPETWLARKWECFHVAEGLARLREPSLSLVAVRCGEGDRDAEDLCLGLLEAEASCINGLPVSAARALSIPARGRSERIAVLLPTLSPAARTLAALVLNVIIERQHGKSRTGFTFPNGRLPERPDVIAALITAGADLPLVSRWLALDGDERFLLDPTVAKRLLRAGVPPEEVIEIAESLASFGEVVRRALAYRHLLPEDTKARDNAAVRLSAKREEALDCLAEMMQGYVVNGSAKLVPTLCDYAETISDVLQMTGEWRLLLWVPLQEGLKLPPERRLHFAQLLVLLRSKIWNYTYVQRIRGEAARRAEVGRQSHTIQALARVAKCVFDQQIAADLFAKGGASCIRLPRWKEQCRYGRLAEIVRRLSPPGIKCYFEHTLSIFEKLTCDADTQALARLVGTTQKLNEDAIPYLLCAMYNRNRDQLSALLRHDRLRSALCDASDLLRNIQYSTHIFYALTEMIGAGHDPQLAQQLCKLVLERESQCNPDYINIAEKTAFAAAICPIGQDFVGVLSRLIDYNVPHEPDHTRNSGTILRRIPALGIALCRDIAIEPRRCLAVIQRLSILHRFGPEAVEVFVEGLSRIPHDEQKTPPLIQIVPHARWYRLHRLVPELSEEIETLAAAQRILNGEAVLPDSLDRIVDTDARHSQELRYLEAAITAGSATEGQKKRAIKLSGGDAPSEARAQHKIADRLPRIVSQAVIAAAEQLLALAYRKRLEVVAGPFGDPIEIGEDMMDAVILTGNITSNRKTLIAFIRATIEGDRNWVATRPQNIAFLESLRAAGVDTEHWLGAHHQTVPCPGVAGGQVTISLETDPIKILPMGSHFSTCLSIDSFNAFSVVANAIELNKRVIYTRDGAGRVVGRKLIGIGDNGKLLGFHTYANTSDPTQQDTLVHLIDRYAADFAKRCGLQTCDEGTVPKLFVDEWYDDGAQPWADGAATDQASTAPLTLVARDGLQAQPLATEMAQMPG